MQGEKQPKRLGSITSHPNLLVSGFTKGAGITRVSHYSLMGVTAQEGGSSASGYNSVSVRTSTTASHQNYCTAMRSNRQPCIQGTSSLADCERSGAGPKAGSRAGSRSNSRRNLIVPQLSTAGQVLPSDTLTDR